MKPRSKGFTLVEVLVGFTILSLFMATALQAFSMGAKSSMRMEIYAKAQILAQSQLETLAASEHLEAEESERQVVLDGGVHTLALHTKLEPGTLPGSLAASVRIFWDGGEIDVLALLVEP